jgi:hypothetical protein
MSTYNFRLSDQVRDSHPGVWGEGTAYAIGNYLKEFFDEVCSSPLTSYSDSDFWWDSSSSDVRPHEVLIYFLDSQADSLVRKVAAGASLGPGGTTLIRSSGNISEVYVRESLAAMGSGGDFARGLAVLAFHEAMHNKLKLGGSLHATGGGGMAATTVFANTKLSSKNIQQMAAALGRSVPQNLSFL